MKNHAIQHRFDVVMSILASPGFKPTRSEQYKGLYRWVRLELAVIRLERAKANLRKQDKKLDAVLDPILFRAQIDQYL